MKNLFRLLPLLLALAIGARAAPAPRPASAILWWTTNEQALDVSMLQGIGITAVLSDGTAYLRTRIYVSPLSLEEVRASIKPIVDRAAPLPVWLYVSAANPVGPRTLVGVKDVKARALLLENLANISRVAKELALPALGFDWEAYGVGQPYTEKPEQLRPLGVDVATAMRRSYAGVRLFGFCPLSFYRKSDGARGLFRGYYAIAGNSGVFFNEDAYGLARQDVKSLLASTADFTHAGTPALGWWPGGNAADPVSAIGLAAGNWKLAVAGGRPGMIYHEKGYEGPVREALRKALSP